ncbi:endo alpha-1,4 polygalactosaminidase [Streptomyces sp. NBC_01795]|uniref:endo alpha-1,4 polygalactosaminidase n=1 Tax=Streptomyces sp. NBC_01795 TaxID=2975943 RepID=UPI002DDB2D1D|nr:endo alpha-1,4 polygalactosaminidase [Streptomyces sp. NBC_01795]WSA90161.1 endo alpha-1,4 polygalactosaminidase [Streptomyces sp. NBC_01795]
MAGVGRLWAAMVLVAAVTLTGRGSPGAGREHGRSPAPRGTQDGAKGWWRPAPGEVTDWDWQISEPYDLSARRQMYDLGLFDLARRMGCDGVEPDQNNPLGNRPGFPVTLRDQHSWCRKIASLAHARGLSVGMKNGHDQPGSVAALVDAFDWALPEECAQFAECRELRTFVRNGKAVFAVDYRGSVRPPAACRAPVHSTSTAWSRASRPPADTASPAHEPHPAP